MAEKLAQILRHELHQLDERIQQYTKRKEAILNLLNTYSPAEDTLPKERKLLTMPSPAHGSLSTLEMAEKVLEKRGEMKPEALMEAIRQEFGVRPAHTLPQMLYVRARARKRFYRTSEGKFGVLEGRRRAGRKAA